MVRVSDILGVLAALAGSAGCFTKPERVPTIGGDSGVDAKRIDGPMSELCFGRDAFTVCLPALPPDPFEPPGQMTIITDEAACTGGTVIDPGNSGPKLCVFAGTTVTIAHDIVARGDLPLVIVATTSTMNVSALIDVSSAPAERKGAGGNYIGCAMTLDGTGRAGGAGGSFGTTGGDAGDVGDGGERGGTAVPAFGPAFVHGGCRGGLGGGDNDRGEGGGAIYLLAKTTLTISGKVNASGQGGAGASTDNQGGGGGGAGGLIALWAGQGMNLAAAELFANGGGGGGGGGNSSGADGGGVSAEPFQSAIGGGGGGTNSSVGGDGAIRTEDGGSSSNAVKGTGGGGGGVGVILNVSGQPLGGMLSPPATMY